jgi:hypothetical protein
MMFVNIIVLKFFWVLFLTSSYEGVGLKCQRKRKTSGPSKVQSEQEIDKMIGSNFYTKLVLEQLSTEQNTEVGDSPMESERYKEGSNCFAVNLGN